MSRWVLISTLIMHRALLFSMKPMPPMSAASWKTKYRDPFDCVAHIVP
jgi:hypothetical protein